MNTDVITPDCARIAQNCNVSICTPTYGGQLSTSYFRSVTQTLAVFHQHRIPYAISTISNESLITRARNSLVSMFLARPKATHLMFIDADIGFHPNALLALLWSSLTSNAEVVVGAYRTKSFDWAQIVKQAQMGVTHPQQLEAAAGKYAIRLPNQPAVNASGLIEVLDAGSGFMLIARGVFEKLISAYPELAYQPESSTSDANSKVHYAFFDTGITGKPPLTGADDPAGRYLSEDYYFCRLWQQLGEKIWLHPGVTLSHIGSYAYQGAIQTVLLEGNNGS